MDIQYTDQKLFIGHLKKIHNILRSKGIQIWDEEFITQYTFAEAIIDGKHIKISWKK